MTCCGPVEKLSNWHNKHTHKVGPLFLSSRRVGFSYILKAEPLMGPFPIVLPLEEKEEQKMYMNRQSRSSRDGVHLLYGYYWHDLVLRCRPPPEALPPSQTLIIGLQNRI